MSDGCQNYDRGMMPIRTHIKGDKPKIANLPTFPMNVCLVDKDSKVIATFQWDGTFDKTTDLVTVGQYYYIKASHLVPASDIEAYKTAMADFNKQREALEARIKFYQQSMSIEKFRP